MEEGLGRSGLVGRDQGTRRLLHGGATSSCHDSAPSLSPSSSVNLRPPRAQPPSLLFFFVFFSVSFLVRRSHQQRIKALLQHRKGFFHSNFSELHLPKRRNRKGQDPSGVTWRSLSRANGPTRIAFQIGRNTRPPFLK